MLVRELAGVGAIRSGRLLRVRGTYWTVLAIEAVDSIASEYRLFFDRVPFVSAI